MAYRPYLYLAYGSNMNLQQFLRRCPGAEPVMAATLPGWRLVFRGVADIERTAGGKLPVALYRITKACERALDCYEGFPRLYRKEYLPVKLPAFPDGTRPDGVPEVVELMYYAMNSAVIAAPSAYYFNVIAAGYGDWGFEVDGLIAAARDAQAVDAGHDWLADDDQADLFGEDDEAA